ncbi:hypothetical protein F511_22780 [Dorcoceras hygrometricum]|uniref:Uncharacterized protein n=1 Tax=Dorcoceras hygrometricum TaxID=472368 RepID=A0A2Z7ATC2_9LAMI|nr:hypothetical protein F511_22780 [Dorcoceras hygrometricum]
MAARITAHPAATSRNSRPATIERRNNLHVWRPIICTIVHGRERDHRAEQRSKSPAVRATGAHTSAQRFGKATPSSRNRLRWTWTAVARHARPARRRRARGDDDEAPPCAAASWPLRCPRPDARLLRQPALEVLTRSSRTDSPRRVGRNKFRRWWRALAAAACTGGGGGVSLPALEVLTRSSRTDSPRRVGRNKFRRWWRALAAAACTGGGGGVRFEERGRLELRPPQPSRLPPLPHAPIGRRLAPPRAAAVCRRLRDRTCFDHRDEELPSVPNLSGLLVQTDEGVVLAVVDLIDDLPPPTV